LSFRFLNGQSGWVRAMNRKGVLPPNPEGAIIEEIVQQSENNCCHRKDNWQCC
jgi:hypothetical protein